MVRGVNSFDATRATRSLCSATNLVNAGYSIEMRPTLSVCLAVEAVAHCFNVAQGVTTCQSECEIVVRSMPSHFPQ